MIELELRLANNPQKWNANHIEILVYLKKTFIVRKKNKDENSTKTFTYKLEVVNPMNAKSRIFLIIEKNQNQIHIWKQHSQIRLKQLLWALP